MEKKKRKRKNKSRKVWIFIPQYGCYKFVLNLLSFVWIVMVLGMDFLLELGCEG